MVGTDEEEEEVRTQLRLTGLVLISALLAACGGGVRGAGQGTTSSSAPDGTPVHSSSSEISGASAGSAEGTDPAGTTDRPVAGSNAPPGFVTLRGSGDSLLAVMTDGDGSAEPLLLTDPPLGEDWQVVEPDGPMFVQTVCGVQLDPVQPRDAAHRRWGWVENFTYLTSEVHTFTEPEAQRVATDTAAALRDCDGYGLDGTGKEVPSGQGVHQVSVERLGGLPEGWVGWTETTGEGELVRHNAIKDVDGGWHWVSVASFVGLEPDVEVLRAALAGAG